MADWLDITTFENEIDGVVTELHRDTGEVRRTPRKEVKGLRTFEGTIRPSYRDIDLVHDRGVTDLNLTMGSYEGKRVRITIEEF